jgi:hypothetical protein
MTKAICAQYGQGSKPIWNTEWGFGTWVDELGVTHKTPENMSEQYGSDIITRMLVLSWVVGFKHFFFYGFDAVDSYATIVMVASGAQGTLLRPARAYAYFRNLLVNGYLSGFQQAVNAAGKPYYKVSFTTEDGRMGRIFWSPGYTTASVPVDGATSITDNVGAPILLASTINATRSPVFVFF